MRRIARGHTAFPEHIGASFIIWHHFRSVVLVSHRPKLLLIPQDKWPALWRAGTGGLQHMVASLYRRRSMNEGSPMRRPTDLIIEPAAEHNDAASPCPDLHEPNDREAWAVSPSIFWISGGRALSRSFVSRSTEPPMKTASRRIRVTIPPAVAVTRSRHLRRASTCGSGSRWRPLSFLDRRARERR